jgi:hypothetical protein
MANAAQTKALLQSHAEGDDTRFYAFAIPVAAKNAGSGHGRLAQDLRTLVDWANADAGWPTSRPQPIPLVCPQGELASPLTMSHPKARNPDMGRALFRRFDAVIEYRPPSQVTAAKVMRSRLALRDREGVDQAAAEAAEGLSHADVTRACEQAAKTAILAHSQAINTGGLVEALTSRETQRGTRP